MNFDGAHFRTMPLIAILRGVPEAVVPEVADAIADGGMLALEITMNSPGATRQIRQARDAAGARLAIGAGTVTTLRDLDEACAAGASFIVTPVVDVEVLTACAQRGLPVFPGAYTPSEIHQAHRLGATMVKLFPANRLGPDYVRDLRAPLAHIPLLATGGITPESIPDYVRAGVDGFGLGSPLVDRARVEARDWPWLRTRAREFCQAWTLSQRKPAHHP